MSLKGTLDFILGTRLLCSASGLYDLSTVVEINTAIVGSQVTVVELSTAIVASITWLAKGKSEGPDVTVVLSAIERLVPYTSQAW